MKIVYISNYKNTIFPIRGHQKTGQLFIFKKNDCQNIKKNRLLCILIGLLFYNLIFNAFSRPCEIMLGSVFNLHYGTTGRCFQETDIT